MKVLLVQPQLNEPITWAQSPSMALLILGTLAQQRGHDVEVIHLPIDCEDIGRKLRESRPDIVGITCNTFQVKSAKSVAKLCKNYGIKAVIGGPHACVWEGTEEVVIGEGENKWLEILGETPDIKSINDIPIPNYELTDLRKFTGISPVGAVPSACMMASRGCPFRCIFCNTPVFWGKEVKYRDPKLVLEEVDILHKRYGMNEIFFQDDTFNLNHKWASEIFEGIIKNGWNNEMLFKICCRSNKSLVTKEFMELASRAGVWNVFFGVESGSQQMLDSMQKDQTIEEIIRAFDIAHEAGLKTQASFVVGMPGETMRTLRDTSDLMYHLSPTQFGWVRACPFPNTEFRRQVVEKGHLLDIPYEEYVYGKSIVRTDEISFEELASFGGFKFQEV